MSMYTRASDNSVNKIAIVILYRSDVVQFVSVYLSYFYQIGGQSTLIVYVQYIILHQSVVNCIVYIQTG